MAGSSSGQLVGGDVTQSAQFVLYSIDCDMIQLQCESSVRGDSVEILIPKTAVNSLSLAETVMIKTLVSRTNLVCLCFCSSRMAVCACLRLCTCLVPCVCVCGSVDRIQQLRREYQLARREGMVPPYEELDPRRRGLENDIHRVRQSDTHVFTPALYI